MDIAQDEMREILEEFFTEAGESLDALEQDLIRLETLADTGGTDVETVSRLFRVLHTLKGGAGFLGLEKMAKLAHAGENLLDEVRSNRVAVGKEVMDALLTTNDLLKQLLSGYRNHEDVAGVDVSDTTLVLEQLSGRAPKPVTMPPATVVPTAPAPAAAVAINTDLLNEVLNDPTLEASRDKGGDEPAAAAPPAPKPAPVVASGVAINTDLLNEVLNDPTLEASRDKGDEPIPAAPAVAAPAKAPEMVMTRGAGTIDRREEVSTDRRAGTDERRKQNRRDGAEGTVEATIRVETSRLDKVMNLVGELVLARNSLMRQMQLPEMREALNSLPNPGFMVGNIEVLSRVTQDLQMSVLSTRMQPIKKVFDKIPRQVRELKNQLKKEIDLIIEGEETEVDKTLVEELADPMVHLIRNSLDHGIETPAEREAKGKHPTGTLAVRAFYEGNNVVIQVQDDGKGIDPDRIKRKAVEKGLISADAASLMSDKEAVKLIMAAGFSTAEKVTDVSGRGVGMDVVNSKIATVKGTIDITSEVDIGTTISIYLPLTLAIVQALVVESCREGFAIPIGDISEVIKFKPENIHKVNERDIIELRGEALPLFYLKSLTRGVPTYSEQTEIMANGKPRPKGYVIVVRDSANSVGLVVDRLIGQEEAVVKPVSDMFEFNKAISGATIMGDGSVHMILDVPYLMKDIVQTARAG